MKKVFKNRLLIFVLGTILSGSMVYAFVFYAQDISYDNTTSNLNANNVQDAIDILYSKSNNKKHVESGSKSISLLTSSWTYDDIYFNDVFSSVPTCYYRYNANGNDGAVFIHNVYIDHFTVGYHEGNANIICPGESRCNTTLYWACYE